MPPARKACHTILLACLILLALAGTGCDGATPGATEASPLPVENTSTPAPTEMEATPTLPSATPAPPSATATELPPDFWKTLPVIPASISERVRDIYRLGLEMGNDRRVFSRIGDCASAAPAFLTGFDRDYNLGEYAHLQPAIDYFKGSFKRPSLAAKFGLNTAGLLSTLWTGEQCVPNETLLDCQYRLDQPSFAIISIGTNESYYVHHAPGSFESNMRIILDGTIAQGIVPILSTKADNIEGDESINATIARLALEYELPLWNFWAAVQDLPNKGMLDPSHLNTVSYANYTDFTIPHSLDYGMQVRNLTALQMLYFILEQLVGIPPTP